MEEHNAIIKTVSIYYHQGFLTVWIGLDFGGEGQSFGGFKLYSPKHEKEDRTGYFLYRCFQTLEVNNLDDLINLGIRVRKESLESNIHAIGHLIRDRWFSPIEEFEEKFHENSPCS